MAAVQSASAAYIPAMCLSKPADWVPSVRDLARRDATRSRTCNMCAPGNVPSCVKLRSRLARIAVVIVVFWLIGGALVVPMYNGIAGVVTAPYQIGRAHV